MMMMMMIKDVCNSFGTNVRVQIIILYDVRCGIRNRTLGEVIGSCSFRECVCGFFFDTLSVNIPHMH